MIVWSRGSARAFRALARKCVAGRPRGPAPVVVFEVRAGTLTVWTRTADAGLAYTAPTDGTDRRLLVPMATLADVEGGGDEPVEWGVETPLTGTARWADRGVPRTTSFDAVRPDKSHRLPGLPDEWHPVPDGFVSALHECGRTAATEPARFALNRVQVRGATGQVIGTDGRSALVCGGFTLPFRDDVLIPAVPVFGAREWTAEPDVRVGRAGGHLVVAAGPWRVFLSIDTAGRYPDVAGLVPKTATTTIEIADGDAAALAVQLASLPGAETDDRSVTLDTGGGVAVRAQDEATGRFEEVRLARSTAAGPPIQVAIDRRILARALTFGCGTVRVTPGKPVVFAGADRALMCVALDPAHVVEPADTAALTTPIERPRRSDMKHETNGPRRPTRPTRRLIRPTRWPRPRASARLWRRRPVGRVGWWPPSRGRSGRRRS
ncbi:hypothetical protein [Fimbriiglobus ruber]|uniref:DNA polymerase III beta subunit n=1 Tax=Fimbriiglobus ruber TaxID=1908690 RepID=A0A225D3C7_9BACT|nr:hypothetical protein [Fimbriiglobus ruber]OWK34104.1 hypothetical protein FRUB_10075 [Fimbriiglobus ruber]